MTHDQLDADLDRLRAAHFQIPDPHHDHVQNARSRVLATIPVAQVQRPGTPRTGRRRTRKLLGIAVGGILVGGTAVAATTPWHPQLGGGDRRTPATRSARTVPAAMTDHLAVLRRPQSDIDRTASVQRALGLLDRDIAGGVYVDGIRHLKYRQDGTVILVPMRRYGPKNLPGVAPQLNGLCVYVASSRPAKPGSVGGASCGTVADLGRRGIGSITTGLVPDGVDRVRVTLKNGRTLTAKVTDNYYELPFTIPDVPFPADGTITPGYRAAQRHQLRVTRQVIGRPKIWLGTDGRPVRKTS